MCRCIQINLTFNRRKLKDATHVNENRRKRRWLASALDHATNCQSQLSATAVAEAPILPYEIKRDKQSGQ